MSRSAIRRIIPLGLAVIGLIASLHSARAADPAQEFNAFINPAGDWSHGWSAAPGSAFNLFTTHGPTPFGVDTWTTPAKGAIKHLCTFTSRYEPGVTLALAEKLNLVPGAGGEFTTLRWIAPVTGTYRAIANFAGLGGYPFSPADWIRNGGQASAQFGTSVAGACDVNGDGYDDVIVGEPFYDSATLSNCGRALLYLGAATGLSATPSWTREGGQSDALLGTSVASAGDIDGDGFDDVIVGEPLLDRKTFPPLANVGAALVFRGSAAGLSNAVHFSIVGDQAGGQLGASVAGAGDVNGDGFDDVIVGASAYDNGQTDEGKAFAWFGSATGLGMFGGPANADWSAESDQASATFGWAVAGIGDVNGDGFDEVVVGTPYFDDAGGINTGRVFVYYGSATGPSVALSWRAQVNDPNAQFGSSVAGAGDVNGDGFADLIVGAPNYGTGDIGPGAAFAWFGGSGGLGAFGTQSNTDWFGQGNQPGGHLGRSVAGTGDINRDGYSDIIVGQPNLTNIAGVDAGGASFGLGNASGIGPNGSSGFDGALASDQAGAQLGSCVAGAGNVNGDNHDDTLIGAPHFDAAGIDAGQAIAFLSLFGLTPAQTSAEVAVLSGASQLAHDWLNLNGGGNTASFTTVQSLAAGQSLDFAVGDGGNGAAFDAVSLNLTILPVVDPTGPDGPIYAFAGQRFASCFGGPRGNKMMDGIAFDPVHHTLAGQGRIVDLCGNQLSAGPSGNPGIAWDLRTLTFWELLDDNTNARWVVRRWDGATLVDTACIISRVLSVPGTGADTLEDARGIAVDSNFVYIVDAGPPGITPHANAWFKFTRAGVPVKSLKFGGFSANSTGDVVDDILYSPFSSSTAPGQMLVPIEHTGMHILDTNGALKGSFVWSLQNIDQDQRPVAFAGLALDPTSGNLYLLDNDPGRYQVWTRLPDQGATSYVLGSDGARACLEFPIAGCRFPLWKEIATLACNQTPFLVGIAYRPQNNRVYGCDYGSGDLWRFDPRSGGGERVGATGQASVAGMAYDSDRDQLYGHQDVPGRVFVIDPATAAATPLPNPVGFNVYDLAFNPVDHEIYGVSRTGALGQLIRIDRDTGIGTPVALTVPVTGLDWDSARNQLLGFGNESDTLFAIDPANGAATFVSRDTARVGTSGLAVIPVTPAPVVSVEDKLPAASNFALRAWPNPFRGTLALDFALERAAAVELSVFDVAGRRVRGLRLGVLAAGPHRVPWDGRDAAGNLAAAGLYFVRVQSAGRALSARVARVK